ncbi:MAG: rhomboid family intramembrane serine protease [Peptoniphilaceae bacterium]|nr:rhomboid family intramembrane serine protease [Peptoniphilaceae bacterium]MDD7383712.1 rhomboid family intramembrane serine protease [Peptoniphilaceae bacterium]MDY3737889.1 rhomboid family intramembrane serine protease [Peptoniphilaceae bacterium]
MKNKKITYALIIINLIVFALMEITGSSTDTKTLLKFGAMFKPLIFYGQYFRFITPIFVHIGLIHLLMNSYSLYILGPAFESLYGSFKFLIIYILSGIMGNILSFALADSLSISAGASTSLYGLFGLALGFTIFYRNEPYLKRFGKSFLIVIIINIFYSITNSSIGIFGHLGGLLGGFLLSGIFSVRTVKIKSLIKIVNIILFISLSLVLLYVGFINV